MSTKPPVLIVLDLNNLNELFNAPRANPFSERETEILGEAGIDRVQKLLVKKWPRWPGPVYLTLRLPSEQTKPGLETSVQEAIRRYCTEQIQANYARQRNTLNVSWRQLGMAFLVLLLAAVALYFGFINPLGILRPYLGPLLAILILFAGSVSIFDALWSVMFDWIPYLLDIRTFERMTETKVVVEGRD
jgi:hypothetical protein